MELCQKMLARIGAGRVKHFHHNKIRRLFITFFSHTIVHCILSKLYLFVFLPFFNAFKTFQQLFRTVFRKQIIFNVLSQMEYFRLQLFLRISRCESQLRIVHLKYLKLFLKNKWKTQRSNYRTHRGSSNFLFSISSYFMELM